MEESGLLDQLRTALATQYDVERVLGHGGMGVVVLGRDRALDRPVAIKVISPHVNVTARHRQRFLQEARIVANLRHPNIVAVYTAGEADGLLYFVMEYVPGESLRDLLTRDRCCHAGRAEAILRDLAAALAFAHARGVVHRDIKPENVLLDHDTGRAMLADFGVAQALASGGEERLTGPGVVVGSPQYMSPEQAAGERDLDGRSDIYALGLVGYEMLAGEPAFAGESVVSVLTKQLTEPPPPLAARAPDASTAVVAAITRALEKHAEDRWQTADDMARALAGEAVDEPAQRTNRDDAPPAAAPASAERAARVPPPHPERPDPVPFVGPGRPPARAGRARRSATWLATATAVLLLAAPLAWLARPRPAESISAEAATPILVMPFDVQSPDSSLASLRDSSARMVAETLARSGTVSVIDYGPGVRAAGLDTARTIPLASARQVAARAGARLLVVGQIAGDRDSLAVLVTTYDVATGQLIGEARRTAPAGDTRAALDAAAREILDLTRPPPRDPPPTPVSPAAH